MKFVDSILEQLRDRIAASVPAQKLWAYYETAAPREQTALKALGVFLSVVLILLLVILPLHRFNNGAVADYRTQSETLQWMQANRAAIGNGSAQKQRDPGASLLTLANQSAREFGLAFKRYEPNANQGLNLWLEQVPFNQVVKWLEALERDYGIIAVEFSASRRDEAGIVDVRVVLQG
ncbi:MAG: type II secretion system protein GspM [Spongiibacteraceae bacterium]